MSFHIGQKVVFVGGPKLPGAWYVTGGTRLRKGGVYTIRGFEDLYLPYFGMVGIRVAESIWPCVLWKGICFEPANLAHTFRPVAERSTDISIFTRMLTPTPAKVN